MWKMWDKTGMVGCDGRSYVRLQKQWWRLDIAGVGSGISAEGILEAVQAE
jgi:hypothetical protein